jgi:UDP-glucose 4-epimerase
MLAWVIGQGGMLGSALAERAGPHVALFPADPIPWADPQAAQEVLTEQTGRFLQASDDGAWAILWAAGASVVASGERGVDAELAMLTALVEAVAGASPRGRGAVFLASSAGGLYAGSRQPPFDDRTDPQPISPYGELKWAQEQRAVAALGGRVPLVIGRLANLYGPRADAGKAQGLVSQLCLATARRQPLNLYVSMDTVRDYLYVDDSADMAWHLIDRAVQEQPAEPVIAVLASGQPTTVAHVIATVQNVAHRRVPLALGTHPSARHQVVDLRLVPSAGLPAARTPLPSGVKRVFDSVVTRVHA